MRPAPVPPSAAISEPAVDGPALYRADVRHQRRGPRAHSFRYRTLLWLIDIDRPPHLPGGLGSLARFDVADHLDIRALLDAHGLQASRILMLAHARTLGYVFNPATFYWCYAGDRLVATVVEVHNTYGERHAYLLPGSMGRGSVDKALYVSPFHPRHGVYRMGVSPPGPQIRSTVSLRHDDGQPPFVATMIADRHPATAINVVRLSARYPWAPLRVAALIRWQALLLWLRRTPRHPR